MYSTEINSSALNIHVFSKNRTRSDTYFLSEFINKIFQTEGFLMFSLENAKKLSVKFESYLIEINKYIYFYNILYVRCFLF